ncbi:MAG: metallophosphoesterase [Pseudomonadota bacterium]
MITKSIGTLKRFLQKKSAPVLPEDLRIYAIGDVHGRADLLGNLLTAIAADMQAQPVKQAVEIFLGDYVDRGSDSRTVVETLRADPRHSGQRLCLKGNHEAMLLAFLDNPATFSMWRRHGGLATLASYGVALPEDPDFPDLGQLSKSFRKAFPSTHEQFLRNLATIHHQAGYTFVHAGLRPGTAMDAQTEQDCLWIRDVFLKRSFDFGSVVVHGHSPVPTVERYPYRINVDTGAFATGRLSCLVIEAAGLRVIRTEGAEIQYEVF